MSPNRYCDDESSAVKDLIANVRVLYHCGEAVRQAFFSANTPMARNLA